MVPIVQNGKYRLVRTYLSDFIIANPSSRIGRSIASLLGISGIRSVRLIISHAIVCNLTLGSELHKAAEKEREKRQNETTSTPERSTASTVHQPNGKPLEDSDFDDEDDSSQLHWTPHKRIRLF